MTITFHNHIDLSNKWIRRIKYLLYKLKEKFDQILYSHVYLNTENSKTAAYEIKVVLGVPGQDIVYSIADNEVDIAIKRLYNNLKRTLSRWKKRQS